MKDNVTSEEGELNLKIKVENVTRQTASCNFCQRGELNKSQMGLTYPYEDVLGFGRIEGGGLYACICKGCLKELYERGMPLLNKEQEVQASVARNDAQSSEPSPPNIDLLKEKFFKECVYNKEEIHSRFWNPEKLWNFFEPYLKDNIKP